MRQQRRRRHRGRSTTSGRGRAAMPRTRRTRPGALAPNAVPTTCAPRRAAGHAGTPERRRAQRRCAAAPRARQRSRHGLGDWPARQERRKARRALRGAATGMQLRGRHGQRCCPAGSMGAAARQPQYAWQPRPAARHAGSRSLSPCAPRRALCTWPLAPPAPTNTHGIARTATPTLVVRRRALHRPQPEPHALRRELRRPPTAPRTRPCASSAASSSCAWAPGLAAEGWQCLAP
mmetsp:Transcript_40675/g.117670  ORF Transcript_40675/g.117670 Transcript_40675/m.117670 type:complete len:234 (+) Transcript_40675:434-1135(+)